MAGMEERLVERLLALEAISGLVGENIHWGALPDGVTGSSITMFVITPGRNYTMDDADELHWPRIQFDLRGRSYSEVTILKRSLLFELEKAHASDDIVFDEGIELSGSDMPKEVLEGGTEVFKWTSDWLIPYH